MIKDENAMVCLTTVASREAPALSETLVSEKLAACVNELTVTSTFRWKDKVEREDERLLVIKTTASAWPRLCARIRELSTYELPEVLALEAAAVEPAYLAWLNTCVAPRRRRQGSHGDG